MMKKFLAILMAVFVLCNSVLAVDISTDDGGDTLNEISEKVDALTDTISSLANSSVAEASPSESGSEVSQGGNTIYVLNPSSDSSETEVLGNAGIDIYNDTITDISILSSVAPVTPSDTSGLKAVLLTFLGNYDPIIVEYQYSSSQGYNNYLREVQPDYVWIASFCLLALFIFCLFKLGGALIRG